MTSRRKFLKNLSIGASALALAGCTPSMGNKYSYMTTRVDAQNMNPVFFWTDIMLQTVRDQAFNPPRATRAFAMGHLAGFLAMNGIYQEYDQNFVNLPPAPQGADPEVAYGVACSDALADAFQSVFTFDRLEFLNRYPDSEAKALGIQWGHAVGDAIIKMRTRDGAELSQSAFYLGRYPRREGPLKWSPTGPFYGALEGPGFNTFSRGLLPGWGAQKPWVMKDTVSWRAPEFPDYRSDEFARQHYKIRMLGGADSIVRTPDQTQIAFFWEDGPRGITPPGHWQLLAMQLLQDMDYSTYDLARVFAMMSMAQADAAITTWDTKFHHDILRPETAIRTRLQAFRNVSPMAQADPDWISLIPTPPFPAYTSGHSTFSGASAKMLALAIGRDDIKFSGSSPDIVNWPRQLTDITRTWYSLSSCADEAGASREYGGIHWEADNTYGLKTGRELAEYIFNNSFIRKG